MSEDADFQTLFAYLFTIGGQQFLSSNLGNQSLKLTIEEAIKVCKGNDFKELLLRILYADLRLSNHEKKLANFAEATKSRAAVEIIYLKLRELMVKYEKKDIPLELTSAFRTTCERRLEINGQKTQRDEKKDNHGVILRMVEAQVQQVKRQHMVELAKSGSEV